MGPGFNSAQFVIRRATRDDLPQLSALLERYYAEWNVVQRDAPGRIAEYLEQPAPFGFVVVEEKGVLIACVLLRELPAIPSAAECKRLYVMPEHRGEGLASLLMDYVEGLASAGRLQWIYLDTGANFTAAQSLYPARGYESCERYNDNPQAACFFRKRLSR
jgi:N-acetylglutamate synthase-like GNAT family acetyltransferase